jgi:hypothetical protein
VCWDGGQSVYTLDWDTKTWTRVNGTGANPGPTDNYGPYGRWRYVPSKNVFVTVDATDENVFFFRLTGGTGVARAPLSGSALSITATPNPFNVRTDISIKGKFQVTSFKLSIFDIHGKQLQTCNLQLETSNRVSWNVSGMPAGVYMARVTAGNRVLTERIVRMK